MEVESKGESAGDDEGGVVVARSRESLKIKNFLTRDGEYQS